uniref:Melanin-concentrating hormone receptor 1 n=1 Tax=Petromyzon marinus TaxID=7757 RepID=A0AAJ7TRN7_PETMA
MLNLALADLLFLLCMPFLSHQLLGHSAWRFGAPLCRLIVSLDATTQFGSTYLLTALTLDRYLATVRPLGALSLRLRRPRTAAAAIVALWLLALLSATPYWLYARLLPGDDEACSIVLPDQDRDIYWFTLYQFVLGFALPLLVISAAYWRILQRLHSAIVPAGHNRGVRARTRKVTCFAIAICLVFFVCWAPFYALQLLQLQGSSAPSGSDAFLRAYNVAISLCYANSCLNPFVYMAMCAAFRRRVAAAACSCRRRARGGGGGAGSNGVGA